MNLIELQRALRQLRLGGIATVLETRLRQAQTEPMAPIDLLSCLVSDELTRRADRLLERRRKQAGFRDAGRMLDNFDFNFNPKMNRSLVFDLATGAFIQRREDALFLGPGGTGKSHLAQAIGQAAIQQGYKVLYRETHILLEELADACLDGTRKQFMEMVSTVPLLIIDDFGMRKLPSSAAEDLLEIVMRRYERCSTLLTSNRPVDDWGKLLGDTAGGRLDARPSAAPRPCSEMRPAQLAHQNRRDGLTARQKKEGGILRCEGSALALPGFTAFGQNGYGAGRLRTALPFRPWAGAPVASQRCRILRPGSDSIELSK
jgi:DNA replication protein DnaC